MADPLDLLTKLLRGLAEITDGAYTRTEMGVNRALDDMKALKQRAEIADEERAEASKGAVQK